MDFLRQSFDSPAPSVNYLIQQYLYYAENVRGLSKETLKSRRVYLKQFHEYLIEKNIKDISTLSNIDLDIYHVEMANRISVHTGRIITTGTVNTSKRAIKSFLRYCLEYLEIPVKVKLKEIRERRRDDKYPQILTHQQITEVIKKTKNKQDKLIISVMYEAGLRISEVMGMKIEHLRGTTLDVVGKGKKHRITYLTPKLANQIRQWMDENMWADGYVFRPQQHGDGNGGYVNSDTIRQRIKKLFLDILGIVMHPHLIRHAFALRLLKKGCGLVTIQRLLGHSKIETTMIYLGIDNEYLQKEHTIAFNKTVFA